MTEELRPQPKFKKGQLVNDTYMNKQFIVLAIDWDDDANEWLYSRNNWHFIPESDLTAAGISKGE